MRTIDSRQKNASGQLVGTPMQREPVAEVVGIDFEPPAGVDLKGRKGTATVAWARKPDGKLSITSINGVSIGSPEREAEEASEMEGEEEGAAMADEEMA